MYTLYFCVHKPRLKHRIAILYIHSLCVIFADAFYLINVRVMYVFAPNICKLCNLSNIMDLYIVYAL